MDVLTARLPGIIDKCLTSSTSAEIKRLLVKIRDLFDQLLQTNYSGNEWTRLLCQRLNRTMNNNDSIPDFLWVEWYSDLGYVLNGQNAPLIHDHTWQQFLKKMEFEREMEKVQRQRTLVQQKSLSALLSEYDNFFREYLQKCISFHSKVQLRGLVENIDDLLCKVYELTEVSLSPETKKFLQEKLQCIEIDLDCSNKSLVYLGNQSLMNQDFDMSVDNRLNNFLPSIEQQNRTSKKPPEKILNLLQSNRWIVVLGEPGCAKTSLLRWITRMFAEAAQRGDEELVLQEDHRLAVRIPILIRIGEFATWLKYPQTETLIDYIGEHTWFTERYCRKNGKSILKELIDHGHALILLDGLDETLEIGRTKEIVDLVKKFIDEYVRAPDFISAFDELPFDSMKLAYPYQIVQTQRPSKSGGNQIILTSRFVGYYFYPFVGSFIEHYSLSLMKPEEAKEFGKMWMTLVGEVVIDVLTNEGIPLEEENVTTASKKRLNSVESMFNIQSQSFLTNPSLLTLICTIIFQSINEFHPESRLEVYDHTVQAVLHSWRNQQTGISDRILNHFLIDLAHYLHLNSPSGLIDDFDMRCLCRLSLQQQSLSKNRRELNGYTDRLMSSLKFNVAVFAERGLQVFGFLHLSLQEYFLAQYLVRDGSIEDIIKRVLACTVHSRFREPLLLAIGWVSSNWSFDDYDQFCKLFIIPTSDYSIPLGTLLLFDALDDMAILPSNAVIFAAVNYLFNHSLEFISRKYLLWSLSRLPDDMIEEWMNSYLTDDQSILKFCQSCLTKKNRRHGLVQYFLKLSPVISKQLWLLHDRSSLSEIFINQTLGRTRIRDDRTGQLFNKDLFNSSLSATNDVSRIHPLVLSVIIALCGGLDFTKDNIRQIVFSPKNMHRESSILAPIMEYLAHNEKYHSNPIETLISEYQKYLDDSLPSDTSCRTVDIFIALICLQGLAQPSIYQKYETYKALSLARKRFRWIWYHMDQSCQTCRLASSFGFIDFLTESELKSIVNLYRSQPNQSDEELCLFASACATPLIKCSIVLRGALRQFVRTHNTWIDRYLPSQLQPAETINANTLMPYAENANFHQNTQQNPIYLLLFLPQSLQRLFYHTTIISTNSKDALPLIVLLSECLKPLDKLHGYDVKTKHDLLMLEPFLEANMLENYGSVLFHEKYTDQLRVTENWVTHIDVERQRIFDAQNAMPNAEKDLRLFAASITLARLLQGQYHFHEDQGTQKNLGVFVENEDVYSALMNILDPLLRIVALNIILTMEKPQIFNEKQRKDLQCEMIGLLYSLFVDLPLLTMTFLFIRCHMVRPFFPDVFQEMSSMIGEKLNTIGATIQSEEQKAAFVALRLLKNSDLSRFLFDFARQTSNLPDLLHFNSTVLYRFFTHTISFESCNTSLLSVMYLTELAFDVQHLKIYTEQNQEQQWNKKIPSQTTSKPSWMNSLKDQRTMTFEIATRISESLPTLNKVDFVDIIKFVCRCLSIENEALPVIANWIDYRTNDDLEEFALYAALEQIIQGSTNSHVIDTAKDLLKKNIRFHLTYLSHRLFNSPLINLTVLRQILIVIQNNRYFASNVSVSINRKDAFELILDLELEQINSTTCNRSYLEMIESCSEDLQNFLLEHLQTSLAKQSIKEEFITILVKWIFDNPVENESRTQLFIDLYKYIFTLLHDQQFPQVRKIIANALDWIFHMDNQYKKFSPLQNDIVTHLERVITRWDAYPKDLLEICLLAYGGYLARLRRLAMKIKIPDEFKTIFNQICARSFFPETISIRASFCLILIESSLDFNMTIKWFDSKWNLTLENRCKILFERKLYFPRDEQFDINQFVEYFEACPQLLDRFVIDLYDYLDNEKHTKNTCDRVPNYIRIAREVASKKPKEFCNAVRKSSFGEQNFKTRFYERFKSFPKDLGTSINLYSVFGIFTVEFLDILCLTVEKNISIPNGLDHIKQVSDRTAVDKLFDLLNSRRNHAAFQTFLSVLISLTKANAVSFSEVHERLLLIDDNLSNISHVSKSNNSCVFDFLMSISCLKNETNSLHFDEHIYDQNDVDEQFQEKIEYFDENTSLVYKILFLNDFIAHSDRSN